MSRGVNKAIIVGTLGADPEVKYTASGGAVTKIRVATNESWNDKATGERQERTEWHRVTFFGKLAEIAGEYLKKGRQVYVEGAIRTDKYTDAQGVERYSTGIVANEMQMLGGPREAAQDGADGGGTPARTGRPAAAENARAPAAKRAPPAASGAPGFDDDDIPF